MDSNRGFDRFIDAVLLFDIYGSNMELLLPKDRRKHKTVLGAILTVATLILFLSYATYKGFVLLNSADIYIDEQIE